MSNASVASVASVALVVGVCAVCCASVCAQTPAGPGAPAGALSGKIVYLTGGHGWTSDNLGSGAWFTQRPETFEMVEDLTNGDFLAFQADDLFRAGATVVPLRPIGRQVNEVVVDNDDPGVELVGSWSVSSSPQFFGEAGDVPYLFTNTSLTETAVARYRPVIPVAGRYPVYTWVLHSFNRVDQLYRVAHSGGVTEVRVDHSMVGSGLVYLGTYHFDAGSGGYVEISNQSTRTGVVIADMIRFGNGMGDIDRGGGPSGEPRADEAALYWIETHAGQGVSSSVWRVSSEDGTATVSAPTRWATHMNREQAGSPSDRVFVGHHSNAGGGAARGVIGLYNGNNDPSTETPNQFLLALTLAQEINDDMVSLNGSFEHNWFDRTTLTLDRTDFEFGEINNQIIQDEFDATIVERGFHDNQLDAELMRDTRVNGALAKATTQGVVRFLNAIDPGAPLDFAPGPVETLRAESNSDGTVTLTWTPPVSGDAAGDTPTSYIVQTSPDGEGFANAYSVAGGGSTGVTIPGVVDDPLYCRVFAVNAGGWSAPSPVVGARPATTGPRILVVNGFDRQDRFLNVREGYLAGVIDRVLPEKQNARDYSVAGVSSASVYSRAIAIDTAQNEDVAGGGVVLGDYDAVVWLLGEESVADQTIDASERALVEAYLNTGGDLLISGTEIGWELDFLGVAPAFFNDVLFADYVADDAGTYNVAGSSGSAFQGLVLSFDSGVVEYNAEFPDVLAPVNGSIPAFGYLGGLGGSAGIQRSPGAGVGALVVLGFPFETILGSADRDAVMGGFLGLAGLAPCAPDLTTQGAGSGDPGFGVPDGLVTASDIQFYVNLFVVQDPAADLTTQGAGSGDPGFGVPDGQVTASDIQFYVNLFVAGCP